MESSGLGFLIFLSCGVKALGLQGLDVYGSFVWGLEPCIGVVKVLNN